MVSKRHKKRNQARSQPNNTPATENPTIDNSTVNEASQATETGNEVSSSGDRAAVNEDTSQPNEVRAPRDILSLPLYGNDSDPENQENENTGAAAAPINPVIARAQGAGEASGLRMPMTTNADSSTVETSEIQISGHQLDLDLRPAPSRSHADSMESEEGLAESEERSEAEATQGTENVEASRATPDFPDRDEDRERDCDENRVDQPSSTEPDCPTQLQQCREEKKDLEERLEKQRRELRDEIKDLEEWLRIARKETKAAEDEAKEASLDFGAAIQQLDSERDELNKEIHDLRQKLAECEQHRNIAAELQERQKKIIRECARDARQAGNDHVETLITDLEDRNAEVAALKGELASLTALDPDTDVVEEVEEVGYGEEEVGDVVPGPGQEDEEAEMQEEKE